MIKDYTAVFLAFTPCFCVKTLHSLLTITMFSWSLPRSLLKNFHGVQISKDDTAAVYASDASTPRQEHFSKCVIYTSKPASPPSAAITGGGGTLPTVHTPIDPGGPTFLGCNWISTCAEVLATSNLLFPPFCEVLSWLALEASPRNLHFDLSRSRRNKTFCWKEAHKEKPIFVGSRIWSCFLRSCVPRRADRWTGRYCVNWMTDSLLCSSRQPGKSSHHEKPSPLFSVSLPCLQFHFRFDSLGCNCPRFDTSCLSPTTFSSFTALSALFSSSEVLMFPPHIESWHSWLRVKHVSRRGALMKRGSQRA